jgi:hypothetical protein
VSSLGTSRATSLPTVIDVTSSRAYCVFVACFFAASAFRRPASAATRASFGFFRRRSCSCFAGAFTRSPRPAIDPAPSERIADFTVSI